MGNQSSKKDVEYEVENLRAAIEKINTSWQENPMRLQILVFGPTGTGKSSFCNGIIAAMERRDIVPHVFPVAASFMFGSFTGSFHVLKMENISLIDMVGLHNSDQITDENIREVLQGNINFHAKITNNLERREGDYELPIHGYNGVSCVVIMYNLGSEMPHEIMRHIQCVMKLAAEGEISYHLVLTHVDEVDRNFKNLKNLPNVLKSSAVQKAIQRISAAAGIPPAYISVVRNYSNDSSTDVYSSLLFLRAFRKIVISASDQANKVQQKRRAEVCSSV